MERLPPLGIFCSVYRLWTGVWFSSCLKQTESPCGLLKCFKLTRILLWFLPFPSFSSTIYQPIIFLLSSNSQNDSFHQLFLQIFLRYQNSNTTIPCSMFLCTFVKCIGIIFLLKASFEFPLAILSFCLTMLSYCVFLPILYFHLCSSFYIFTSIKIQGLLATPFLILLFCDSLYFWFIQRNH